jgi:predicted nuclease with TOPRIM domain
MMDMETLVGRLMELETKYYELQDKYHHLINEYEKLKDEKGCTGHRNEHGERFDPFVRNSGH